MVTGESNRAAQARRRVEPRPAARAGAVADVTGYPSPVSRRTAAVKASPRAP